MHDAIFAIGSLIFFFALLPSVFGKDKPNALTSAITATVLYIFAFTYLDMGFEYAALVTLFTGILWNILLGQKLDQIVMEKRNGETS